MLDIKCASPELVAFKENSSLFFERKISTLTILDGSSKLKILSKKDAIGFAYDDSEIIEYCYHCFLF